jgi:ATP-dependent helicase HrpB
MKMARLPVHPRLARLLLDAGEAACMPAALLSSGQRVQSLENEPDQRAWSVYQQLRRYVKSGHGDVARALLAAFPDRVARRRPGGFALLSNGQSAACANPPSEFFVAIEAENRVIRLASPIEPEWLMDRITERNAVEWNRQAERVEAVSALWYDELLVEETRGGAVDDEAAAELLAGKVMEAGIERFVNREELDQFLARIEFAAAHSSLKELGEEEVLSAMTELCYGLRSFAEVEKAAPRLAATLERKLESALLERIAPARLKLPSGRTTRVNYERGKPPWIASRLQDFFGLTETPRIAAGKVPLVVHLLAPNQRAVQTTTDLAGFWQRLYPQLRRELGRRYPRHAWPENPLQ